MVSFWRHGFDATTYRSIEEQFGVGIRSLANTFGDKDAMFTKALACYRQRVTDNLDKMFNPPSVNAIITVFKRVSSPAENEDPRRAGCLILNTGFDINEPSEDVANEIVAYQDLWLTTFRQALDADQIANSDARAEFLVGSLWGALSQIRLASDTTAAKPMTSIVIETIQSWSHRG